MEVYLLRPVGQGAVEVAQGYEPAVAQHEHGLAFDDADPHPDSPIVPRSPHTRWHDGASAMLAYPAASVVQDQLVLDVLREGGLGVAGGEDRGRAPEEREHVDMRGGTRLLVRLAETLDEQVARVRQACCEDAHLQQLPGVGIDDLARVASPVGPDPLRGSALDVHAQLIGLRPAAAFRMSETVDCPQAHNSAISL